MTIDPEIWNAHLRTCTVCSNTEKKLACPKGVAILSQLDVSLSSPGVPVAVGADRPMPDFESRKMRVVKK